MLGSKPRPYISRGGDDVSNPRQASTGSGGYLGKLASLAARPHSTNNEPRSLRSARP